MHQPGQQPEREFPNMGLPISPAPLPVSLSDQKSTELGSLRLPCSPATDDWCYFNPKLAQEVAARFAELSQLERSQPGRNVVRYMMLSRREELHGYLALEALKVLGFSLSVLGVSQLGHSPLSLGHGLLMAAVFFGFRLSTDFFSILRITKPWQSSFAKFREELKKIDAEELTCRESATFRTRDSFVEVFQKYK